LAGRTNKVAGLLFSQAKKTSVLLGAAFLVLIGVCDYVTGDALLITVFYLLPISIYAWAVGMKAGMGMAVMSEMAETFADLVEKFSSGNLHSVNIFVYAWNTAGKMFFFMIFAYAVSRMRESYEEQKKLIGELRDREAKLESAYKDLEMFSSAVSHDLRSPLIPIEAFSRILIEDYADTLDDKARDLLTRIGNNAKKMSQLIIDLLSFCRVREKDIRKVEINMEALSKEAFEELRPLAGERKIQLTVLPLPAAYGDSATIHQVLTNLLSNAIKFTRTAEEITIEVGGYTERDNNIYYVKDNGIGFDMQLANKLFGVFQRIHSAKEFEGTGIGLASVKKIIEKHGGEVWAEGKPEQGAAFYFSLPKKVV
jgi:signal transduction histidine kinase